MSTAATAPPNSPPARSTRFVRSTKIVLNFNGEKMELDTAELTPATPVRVNGRPTRFGALSPKQQQRLKMALKAIPEPGDVEFTDPSAQVIPGGTKVSPDATSSTTRLREMTRLIFKSHENKVEMDTAAPTPDTPVRLNGRVTRFGDLPRRMQQMIHGALPALPPPPTPPLAPAPPLPPPAPPAAPLPPAPPDGR